MVTPRITRLLLHSSIVRRRKSRFFPGKFAHFSAVKIENFAVKEVLFYAKSPHKMITLKIKLSLVQKLFVWRRKERFFFQKNLLFFLHENLHIFLQ